MPLGTTAGLDDRPRSASVSPFVFVVVWRSPVGVVGFEVEVVEDLLLLPRNTRETTLAGLTTVALTTFRDSEEFFFEDDVVLPVGDDVNAGKESAELLLIVEDRSGVFADGVSAVAVVVAGCRVHCIDSPPFDRS